MAKRILTIIVGGNMEKDERELFENPKKAMKQPQNVLYLDTYAQLIKFLSPKRLDLLYYLIQNKRLSQHKPVGQIAKELKRKQEAISRDLHYLSGLKLIDLKKSKQLVLAQTNLEGIEIQLAEA